MTFPKEEELFRTIRADDAFVNKKTFQEEEKFFPGLGADDAYGNVETNDTSEAVKSNEKRKLPEKSDEKKVVEVFSMCGIIKEADENLKSELAAGVEEESVKVGPVESVKVCENHPQGVVLVRFKDRQDARQCIESMNGRWFSGRQIHASEDDGSVNHTLVRDSEYDAERLEKFGAELEAD